MMMTLMKRMERLMMMMCVDDWVVVDCCICGVCMFIVVWILVVEVPQKM